MSFQVTVGLLAHNSTVSRGAPVWWACRWLVASDPESEVKWDLEGTSGRKWKRQQPLLPDISLGKGGFGHLLCTLGISWELWVSTVFATGQSANYRDQSREKGECQHMCLFEMQMTLRKGNNNCYGSCKIKKKNNRKTSGMLLQAHTAPLAWTLPIQLQEMNIMRVPGLLGQINLRHPFCAAGWKIFLAS